MADPLGRTAPDGCGRLGLGVSIGWLDESQGNDIAQIFGRLWRNGGLAFAPSDCPLRQLKDRRPPDQAVQKSLTSMSGTLDPGDDNRQN